MLENKSTPLIKAKEIMIENLFDPIKVAKIVGLPEAKLNLEIFQNVPVSQEVLYSRMLSHVLIPDLGLSLKEIFELQPEVFNTYFMTQQNPGDTRAKEFWDYIVDLPFFTHKARPKWRFVKIQLSLCRQFYGKLNLSVVGNSDYCRLKSTDKNDRYICSTRFAVQILLCLWNRFSQSCVLGNIYCPDKFNHDRNTSVGIYYGKIYINQGLEAYP